ncbi:putative carbon monoxide dehydrogenase subunit G protein (plasmid) [Sinorhizobium fredii NGR234]|uniref:Carbon monoxide dehydrogenase subunit G protein n=1 Tax=Sinorhizobium fredii (strain NBRC 101917 / NGR234) TaxID=394 RepID=C3KNL5_SINFN|nr:carbon monoxide dehydrogenase subunit G [Sinorhizobium fredii]ACP21673.1 putative carbon monoxide dehydrogenase subunit G protein [Sinorhizobium fredii NGR234]
MDMKGEYRIAAPREHVWALINDSAVLKDCIPGCDSLEGTPETGYAARVTTKIGPVKATFAGEVMLSNVQAPESLTISGEGKGGVAGFAKGGADVQLFVDGSETVLTYIAKAQVGGKLAQLGARLIDSTAKKLADEFFEKLATRAASEAADAGVTERAAATIVPVKQAKSAETARAASATVEAAAPATAQAVSTAKPPRRFPFVAFGLVAVTVVIIAALAV